MNQVVKVCVALQRYEIVRLGISALMESCTTGGPPYLTDILYVQLAGAGPLCGRLEGNVVPDIMICAPGDYPQFKGARLIFGQDFEATVSFPELLRKIRTKLNLGPYKSSLSGAMISEVTGEPLPDGGLDE